MSKLLLVAGVFVFVAGCRWFSAPAKNVEVANNTNTAVTTPSPTERASVSSPTATPGEVMPTGVTVEKIQTVKFADGKFTDGWQWIDPDGEFSPTPHEFVGGRLKMTITTTKDLYGDNRTAPRLVKAVRGDFQIETRVTFDPTQDYQGAGLLIYTDGDNYIRFERSFGGIGGGGSGMRLDTRVKGEYAPLITPIDIPTATAECDLKITRRLNIFSVYWRENESSEWRVVEDIETSFPETILTGVVGCNTASEIKAEFSNIRLSPQPLQKLF